jgi:hypothetical protein
MAMVRPNVAVAIPDLVGESFDFFGDGGCEAIVAKVGGGAAAVSGSGVVKPFPGVGGLDWRISRIDVGLSDGSLGVVEAHFPEDVFVLVHPCTVEGFETPSECGGGGSWLLHCMLDTIVGSARGKLHMVKGTWVLAMEVAMVASRLPWFQTLLVVLLSSRPWNWWNLSPNYLARGFVNIHLARL